MMMISDFYARRSGGLDKRYKIGFDIKWVNRLVYGGIINGIGKLEKIDIENLSPEDKVIKTIVKNTIDFIRDNPGKLFQLQMYYDEGRVELSFYEIRISSIKIIDTVRGRISEGTGKHPTYGIPVDNLLTSTMTDEEIKLIMYTHIYSVVIVSLMDLLRQLYYANNKFLYNLIVFWKYHKVLKYKIKYYYYSIQVKRKRKILINKVYSLVKQLANTIVKNNSKLNITEEE
jgi:hypothetical protein